MFRISTAGAAAFALAIGVWTTANATDRIDRSRYEPDPPCVDGRITAPPCRTLPAPCGWTATSEIPCQPKKRCWIEPWMCRDEAPEGGWRIR